MKKKVLSVLLAAAMVGSLGTVGACAAESEYQYPETLENADITVLWSVSESEYDPDTFDAVWSVKDAFEEKYGGTVTVISVEWGEMKSTLISKVNAGETLDLAEANDQNFPIYAAKHLVQDISQYVDVNDGFWYESVSNAFSYDGTVYAAGVSSTPVVIYYNKTLFEEFGVKTPSEYYEEGNWTWDTFREVCLEMTGDTDGDGVNDTFGYNWWDTAYVAFMGTNGVSAIDYTGDQIQSNYTTTQGQEVFQFLQDAILVDKFIDAATINDFTASFTSGKLAMTSEYGFAGFNAYACDYELDWVPMPQGPSGDTYSCYGSLTGWAIPETAANPEGAAVFMRMSAEMQLEYNNSQNVEKYGEEATELMTTLGQNINFSPIGIEQYWDANYTIYCGLTDGTPVSTFTQTADEQIIEGAKITLEQ